MEKFDEMKFPDFFYESKEISDLKSVILKNLTIIKVGE